MKAIILSGGGPKGSYQAGAMSYMASRGFSPDLIVGTSIGAINGAAIAHYMLNGFDFIYATTNLQLFWYTRILSSKHVISNRSKWKLGYELLSNNWNGLYDVSPFIKLFDEYTDKRRNYTGVEITTVACAVEFESLHSSYFNNNSIDYYDAVIASGMQPILMPDKIINTFHYFDGGIREVAPLGYAIDNGATEIVAIVCQAENPKHKKWSGSLSSIAGRTLDSLLNEVVNNDIDICRLKNEIPRYKNIKLTVIRPKYDLDVPLDNFTHQHIRDAGHLGYQDASEIWQG
jgi:NTE family protein